MNSKEYQQIIYQKLINYFNDFEVESEWISVRGTREQYVPRVDIAIGPFNIPPGPNLTHRYNEILANHEGINDFLTSIYDFHNQNRIRYAPNLFENDLDSIKDSNQNSRCLVSLEIENKNSRKHIMGSIVNACSLGRVGIGIAFEEATIKSFFKILTYLNFLKERQKNTYETRNFLILSRFQLEEIFNNILNMNN